MTALVLSVPRLRIGSLVLSNTFRHPGVLAKMAATLGSIADGRLVLGLGAGWQENEHRAFGIELARPGVLIERLDEACRIIRTLLDDGAASFAGRHYTVDEAMGFPKPGIKVPLLLGVKGERAMGVAARWADEWNGWTTPEVLVERFTSLDRACERIGRDPKEIRRSTQGIVAFTTPDKPLNPRWGQGGRALITGSAAEMQEMVGRYAEAGLDELVVPDFAMGQGQAALDSLDRFLTEVAAPFR
jgi:alkanesulfonate monooxygenase SsuD/methylene tetrahydromethanopterin reductase-like flavin-dependent oxidoreductase (luciferase family)